MNYSVGLDSPSYIREQLKCFRKYHIPEDPRKRKNNKRNYKSLHIRGSDLFIFFFSTIPDRRVSKTHSRFTIILNKRMNEIIL